MWMDIERLPTDVRWGVWWGIRIATVLSIIAVAAVVIRLAVAGGQGGGTLMVGLGLTIGWYIVAAIVTGSLVGLLRPIGRSPIGGALVGFLAAIPVSFATYALLVGSSGFSAPVAIVAVVTAFLIGGLAGLIIGRDSSHRD